MCEFNASIIIETIQITDLLHNNPSLVRQDILREMIHRVNIICAFNWLLSVK